MATHHIKLAAGLVFGLGLAAAPAFAQGGGQPSAQPGGQYGGQYEAEPGAQPGGQYGGRLGAQPGAQQGAQFGGQQEGAPGARAQGYGASMGATVPQLWVADAALFIGNAANAAHTLSVEEGLNVQAPQVLGDQTQFLLSATNRALTSLIQLQQNAEATDPTAVPSIRIAVGQLIAAKAMANQAAEAVNAGVLGPTFTTNVHAALGHLAAAERELSAVGRAYGVQQFASAGVCNAARGAAALGVGIGGGRGAKEKRGGTLSAPSAPQPGGTPPSATPPTGNPPSGGNITPEK